MELILAKLGLTQSCNSYYIIWEKYLFSLLFDWTIADRKYISFKYTIVIYFINFLNQSVHQ